MTRHKRWTIKVKWECNFIGVKGKSAKEIQKGIVRAIQDGNLAMHLNEFKFEAKLNKPPIKGLNWR